MWHEYFMIYLQTNIALHGKDVLIPTTFRSFLAADGFNKTHDDWHDSSLCSSPTLILSGWCQCIQTVAVLFRPLKDVSPALLSAWLLVPSVWRLSFPCHAQSFSVNPFIHLLVLPASRQLGWEHGTRPARCCFRDTRVLYWNPPHPLHYCFFLKR